MEGEPPFHLRRAIERLREGLFDPLAVRLLTAREDQLKQAVEAGFRAVEAGRAPHLCICGAYGQGKSHSLTYIQDQALKAGFAASLINLDPREIPFHDFRRVYRALLAQLCLPGGESSLLARWRAWAEPQLDAEGRVPEAALPAELPHLFRAVLAGIAQPTLPLSARQRQTRKHASYRPRAFPYLLSRALMGEQVPARPLGQALKYRQVRFYREAPLRCAGIEPYVQMVRGLGRLLVHLGCRGWVVLFDEGESIAQARVNARSRSYALLDRFFFPEVRVRGLFPVFAFTGDFFRQVDAEDYGRVLVRDGKEFPCFAKDYAVAWKKLTRCELQDLSPQEWKTLGDKLLRLHARAYQWHPPEAALRQALARRLDQTQGQETRYRIKTLVDELDLAQQELSPRR
jgi:hypothetical protein